MELVAFLPGSAKGRDSGLLRRFHFGFSWKDAWRWRKFSPDGNPEMHSRWQEMRMVLRHHRAEAAPRVVSRGPVNTVRSAGRAENSSRHRRAPPTERRRNGQ